MREKFLNWAGQDRFAKLLKIKRRNYATKFWKL